MDEFEEWKKEFNKKTDNGYSSKDAYFAGKKVGMLAAVEIADNWADLPNQRSTMVDAVYRAACGDISDAIKAKAEEL